MAHKAIVWGTGRSGKALIRALLEHPEFELVGAWVHSPEKDGKDVGELIGGGPTGIVATRSKDAIMAMDADIVFTPVKGHALVEAHDEDVHRLLRSGKNVLSTRGYLYPWMVSAGYAEGFEESCRAGGVSLYAIGNSPGFVGERLLMAMAGGALRIDAMKIQEAYDCSLIDESTYSRMGFGKSMAAFRASSNFADYAYLYRATFYYIIESQGGQVEKLEQFEDVVLANERIADVTVPIEPGTIRALRVGWHGYVDGRPYLTYELNWWAGPPPPGWRTRTGWTNTIAGVPPMRMDFAYDGVSPDQGSKGFIPGILLNNAREVIAAPPGIVRTPAFGTYRIPPR